MHLSLYYQLEVRDRNGRLLRRTRRHRARSYVRQMVDELSAALQRTVSINATDRGGVVRTIDGTVVNKLQANAAATQTNFGSIVGTGVTAVSISDYDLATPIAEGVGAGQLQHQAQTYGAVGVVGATASFTTSRVFINGSGGSITVREVGLAVLHQDTGGFNRYFLAVRDLVAGGVVVPDGGSVTLVYTIGVTA